MATVAVQESDGLAGDGVSIGDGPAAAAGTAATPLLPPAGGSATAAPSAAAALPCCPARDVCRYTRCYCEENVWHLANTLVSQLPSPWRLFVVFVSNPTRTVPLWRQRSAPAPSLPVLWDYHVVLLAQLGSQAPLVLDLDSTLPFPCSLCEYRHAALLGNDSSLAPQYRRVYRVVPAPLFLAHFASDRSHMVAPDGQGWLAPPPQWPCLVAESGATNTLPAYLDLSELSAAGSAGSVDRGEAPGNGAPAAEAREQRALQQQQQQSGQHAGGIQWHGDAAQEGSTVILTKDVQPYGAVLPEPGFLRLFGLDAVPAGSADL